MTALDEDALFCDFVETYHIMDWRRLPARRAAVLACGLRAESRIMKILTGNVPSTDTLLLAMIADAAQILAWQNTKNGHSGKNPPASILRLITGEDEKNETFATAEDFDRWRAKMMEGGDANG